MIARSNVIYNNAEIAATAVIVVALITIYMGAVIASAKDDIKKSLAGSTMSQIGYMMLAVGLGPHLADLVEELNLKNHLMHTGHLVHLHRGFQNSLSRHADLLSLQTPHAEVASTAATVVVL